MDSSETTTMAMEWATNLSPSENANFISDFETTLKMRTLISAVEECQLTSNKRIMTKMLFVLGALEPSIQAELIFSLAKQDPKGVSAALTELSKGDEAERISYFNLLETIGRVARHGIFIDVMETTSVEKVKEILEGLDREEGA